MAAEGLTQALIKRRTRHGGSATSDAPLSPPAGKSHFVAPPAPGIRKGYSKKVYRASAAPTSASSSAGGTSAHAARVATRAKRQKERKTRVRREGRKLKQAQRTITKQQKALSKPLPGLSPNQTRVAEKFLASGVKQQATKKQLLSGIETGLVETNLHNLAGGEGTSVGVRQETASSYPDVNRRNVRAAGTRFFSEAKAADVGQSAGTLAQDVQRSAFPGRYAQVQGQAKPILRAYVHRVKKAGGKALIPKGPMKVSKLPGPWNGSKAAVARGLKGIAPVSAGKRTPSENLAVGGSPTSDHLTTNKAAYAKDIPATGTQGTKTARKVARNLGITNFSPGTYDWYTSPKAPGYRFQILWQVEGHFDHVHVGAEYVGARATATTPSAVSSVAATGVPTTASPGLSGATKAKPGKKPAQTAAARRKRQAEHKRSQAASAIGRYRRSLKPIKVTVAKPQSAAPALPKVKLGL